MIPQDLTIDDLLAHSPDHVWLEPEGALLGWGTAKHIDVGTGEGRYRRAREGLANRGELAFASFTFDPEVPGSRVTVPETAVRVTSSGSEVLFGELPGPGGIPEIPAANRQHAPDDWAGQFQAAESCLEEGTLQKIVLSRIVEIDFASDVPSTGVIRNLHSTQAGSYIFGFHGLVGSSPELLASLQGTRFVSLSLAGSSAPGTDGNGQLVNDKNLLEHDLAAASVAQALVPVAATITRSETHHAVFPDIEHLATRFEGGAQPGTTILDLIERLHPTAAVAGTPTDEALSMIRKLEHHQRGRYAGPVGWFDGSGDGVFAIALRCGLIEGPRVTLYSGAGLVAGSDLESELAETELKLNPMRRALRIK